MKRPSFQWYPGDWLNDLALRSCSVAARGLWADMLCLMHQGSTYGYLKVNHKPILAANLARLSGSTVNDVEGWLAELEDAAVFSRDADGAIYSRRMVRDEKVRTARAAGGKLGGNPALKGLPKVGEKVNLPTNLEPTPSSSSSSSSSIDPPKPPRGRKALLSLKDWIEQTRAAGQKLVPDDDPVFAYAEQVRIPRDFLRLAWHEFVHAYGQPGAKGQRDWRAHFRNAVRRNWLKLWYLNGDGYVLSTVGLQAQRAHEERQAA